VFNAEIETITKLKQLKSLEQLNSKIMLTNSKAPLDTKTIN
jgi:hypothetical protein